MHEQRWGGGKNGELFGVQSTAQPAEGPKACVTAPGDKADGGWGLSIQGLECQAAEFRLSAVGSGEP